MTMNLSSIAPARELTEQCVGKATDTFLTRFRICQEPFFRKGVLEGGLREDWLSCEHRKILGYGTIDMMVIRRRGPDYPPSA